VTSIRLRAVGACCLVVCLGLPAGAQAKPSKKVCADAPTGYASCQSRVVTDGRGAPAVTAAPAGFGPADLGSAYRLDRTAGAGRTVAIVDAYDDPNAESDLATYRSTYGLPACTTANGCFRKVNQSGGTKYPRANSGWAEEISLDVDMASAVCPNCRILLVEASSNSLANLGAAVNTASSLGAYAISNSYGGSEYSSEATDAARYYNHPNVTASSGDNGYGVEFPAAASQVTAVGGTSLTRANAGGFSEKAWSGAGSGCSAYIAKPGYQQDTGCARRTVADVSAVADPNTGVAVYDTYRDGGWLVFGGTSVSAPIVASVYALAGDSATVGAAGPYARRTSLNDVVGGSNGSCSPSYLCTALAGYDGPTGLGTPNTAAAF
jgi:subtilase family serine protease